MFYKELWKIIKNNQRLRTSAEREFKHHFYNAKIIQLALYLSHKKIQSVEHLILSTTTFFLSNTQFYFLFLLDLYHKIYHFLGPFRCEIFLINQFKKNINKIPSFLLPSVSYKGFFFPWVLFKWTHNINKKKILSFSQCTKQIMCGIFMIYIQILIIALLSFSSVIHFLCVRSMLGISKT